MNMGNLLESIVPSSVFNVDGQHSGLPKGCAAQSLARVSASISPVLERKDHALSGAVEAVVRIIARVVKIGVVRSDAVPPRPRLYFEAAASGRTIMPRVSYRVYVIELSRRVFTENARFREANPQFNGILQCLYVGMTSKTPQERFQQHKTGYRNAKGHKLSANIVEHYGLYLRPSLYQHIGPMSREEALQVEQGLAMELRRKGYAVWFN